MPHGACVRGGIGKRNLALLAGARADRDRGGGGGREVDDDAEDMKRGRRDFTRA